MDYTAATRAKTHLERFHERYEIDDNECWNWTFSKDRYGYGQFRDHGLHRAHRWGYLHLVGPIPEGLELDHLCSNKGCVNPEHLEPVPHRVNSLRGAGAASANAAKTHCPAGHPYAGDNLAIRPNGDRRCRICHRQQSARWKAQNKK